MRKLATLILFIALSASQLMGQRYQNQIFNEVNVSTETYLQTKDEALKLDIYQPANDDATDRPLLLFVHGGGFAGGARDEYEIMEFCKNMARRGIVAVSMSYTLTMKGKSFGCDQSAENKLATFKQTASEINEATNYLLKKKSELKINPELVIIAGSSAGAEAVLHAAFLPETQKPLPSDFKYAGLISMAGAIIDLNLITKETAMPMQLFHGTCDDLVPYGSAPHHFCKEKDAGYLMLHGAGSISKHLQSLNKGYYLITGCNDNHSWAGKPFKFYREEVANFIYYDLIKKKFRQTHEVISNKRNCELTATPEVCVN
ncbi:hypothetical protein GCM10011506_28130 [Marivirga lumbricoides]|uniref:BD-FAE-like domain-containing protein n=1 Tax=Marivirga lumbricoides TaxID=1046115 RepID=A0ABQ1MLN0_9BACT|nr:hypothetical protein GCM10011506_28130 [Marivirga lumbricoides]